MEFLWGHRDRKRNDDTWPSGNSGAYAGQVKLRPARRQVKSVGKRKLPAWAGYNSAWSDESAIPHVQTDEPISLAFKGDELVHVPEFKWHYEPAAGDELIEPG